MGKRQRARQREFGMRKQPSESRKTWAKDYLASLFAERDKKDALLQRIIDGNTL